MSIFDLVPQFAGYGSVVPGMSTPPFPLGMGTSRPNNTGGTAFTMPGATGWTPAPWKPPTPVGVSAGTPGGGMASPLVPGKGAPPVTGGVTGAGLVNNYAPAGAGMPVNGGAGGSWLDGIIGNISNMGFQELPPLPDMGLPQGTMNFLNYQQYLQNQANQRNQQLFNYAAQALKGQGNSARADAKDAADQQSANLTQDMISRGLTNSTIVPTLQRGVQNDLVRNLARIDENTAQMLINLLQSVTNKGPETGQFNQFLRDANNTPLAGGYLPSFNVNYGGLFGPSITRGNAYTGTVAA